MKKSISLILVLALVLAIFTFVGCGNSQEPQGDEDQAEALKVALVVPSGFGDKSFNDSAKDGADRLVADYGIDLKTIECNSENFKQNMMDAADVAEVVICVGWEFYEIEEVVDEYPEVKFMWIDNETGEAHDNLLNIIYAQNEGSFLAGYVAGKLTTTNIVGAVGGEDSTTINDFIVGYEQGAKFANSEVEVIYNYAGDYENPALGKELALALNDKGADVIFQVAGNTGSGVIEAAAENGFYAIGVDKDQKIEFPNYDASIICSMLKQVGASIYDVVAAYINDGTFEGGTTWVADMKNNYIDLAYGADNSIQQVPDELKAEIETLKQQIVSGEIIVDTTR